MTCSSSARVARVGVVGDPGAGLRDEGAGVDGVCHGGTLGPVTEKPPVAELIAGLADRLGVPAFVAVCTDLMGGAEREEYVEELR